MDTNYFLIIEGQQVGPLPVNELRAAGLTPTTPVWRVGLADWVMASTLPELTEVLSAPAYGVPPRYGQPAQFGPNERPAQFGPGERTSQFGAPRQPYSPAPGSMPGNGLPVAHTNWMPWAIVGTVVGVLFCFIGMIFGILGIVNASKANRFYDAGDAVQGEYVNSSARTNTVISLVLGALGLPLSLYVLSTSMGNISSLLNTL